MQTSEQIDELAKALIGFHKSVGKVKKGSENPFFKSKYASLSDILDVVSEPLTENGFAVIQTPHGEHELTTRLMHESGQWLQDSYTMLPTKPDPQGCGSAITYARRYAIGAILSINIDEDDDGNAGSRTPWNEKQEAKKEPRLSGPQTTWVARVKAQITNVTELVELEGIGELLKEKPQIVRDALRPLWLAKWNVLKAPETKPTDGSAI